MQKQTWSRKAFQRKGRLAHRQVAVGRIWVSQNGLCRLQGSGHTAHWLKANVVAVSTSLGKSLLGSFRRLPTKLNFSKCPQKSSRSLGLQSCNSFSDPQLWPLPLVYGQDWKNSSQRIQIPNKALLLPIVFKLVKNSKRTWVECSASTCFVRGAGSVIKFNPNFSHFAGRGVWMACMLEKVNY